MKALTKAGVAAILVVGCSRPPSIVGTWLWEHKGNSDVGKTYNADGTYRYWFRGSRVNITSEGTYKIDGDRLTETRTKRIDSSGKIDTRVATDAEEIIRWVTPDRLEEIDVGPDPEVGYLDRRKDPN
ncbi:MAG TPA: hypothetical protein VMI31_05310 [Fimbriimonadaceae bacterium]|nr:hypothetical protein [Fimbriimonadaceae bacterium]